MKLAYDLLRARRMPDDDDLELRALVMWLERHLPAPKRFSRKRNANHRHHHGVTWVKLDAGIDNNDGILGAPGALDMNFFGGQFRVWVGGGVHDAIVAKKKTVADVWTHLAVTRDAKGMFRIYQNGELDSADSKPAPQRFENVRIGWTAPGKGTAGWMSARWG